MNWEQITAYDKLDARRAAAYNTARIFLDARSATLEPLRTDQLAELLWPGAGPGGAAMLRGIVRWFPSVYVQKQGDARRIYGRKVQAWYWFGQNFTLEPSQ